MREYAVVLLTAALVTFLTTPVVRMIAIRARMMAAPRERDVHVVLVAVIEGQAGLAAGKPGQPTREAEREAGIGQRDGQRADRQGKAFARR